MVLQKYRILQCNKTVLRKTYFRWRGKEKKWTDSFWTWIVSKYSWYSCSQEWQNLLVAQNTKNLPEDQSVFIIQTADFSLHVGCDLQHNQARVITIGKGLHFLQCSCDIIGKHSLIVNNEIEKQNFQTKSGDILSTEQYKNYQHIKNSHFEKKN